MKWGGKQHPVETLVEWLAPLPLAGATVWACTCLGLSLVEAGALGVIMLVTGLAAMRAGGGAKTADRYHFEPATFEAAEGGLGELLLEAKDEILILDDLLIKPDEHSRVVRLFARHQPTPGELVERIEDFLGEIGRTGVEPPAAPIERPPVDASAALHAALANVRASLR